MSLILAIDPGTTHSGYCLYQDRMISESGVKENSEVIGMIDGCGSGPHILAGKCAIEMIASYGMAVGAEVFETCTWIGRFEEAWKRKHSRLPTRVFRRDVKLHLCGNVRAKDANIRQAIIDLYGGKAEAIGTVKKQGPLYGVKSHAWAALGVAITAAHT